MTVEKFAEARRHMVLSQLRPNQVNDERVVEAMGAVPREEFVPHGLRGVAYLDEDLEVAPGRFLVEPRVFGRLLQEAGVHRHDVILDIGCGTGYSAAVLGRLGQAVVAIESDSDLVAEATETLSGLEADNVAVVEGVLAEGNARQGPYNVIHINGAITKVPDGLLAQLAEGGRLICVIGKEPGVATIYRRQGDVFAHRVAFDAYVPELKDLVQEPAFQF